MEAPSAEGLALDSAACLGRKVSGPLRLCHGGLAVVCGTSNVKDQLARLSDCGYRSAPRPTYLREILGIAVFPENLVTAKTCSRDASLFIIAAAKHPQRATRCDKWSWASYKRKCLGSSDLTALRSSSPQGLVIGKLQCSHPRRCAYRAEPSATRVLRGADVAGSVSGSFIGAGAPPATLAGLTSASLCDASRGGVQMSRGLGSQSGKGQTWSRFPGEACTRSHLLLVVKMRDHLDRKMCRPDGRFS
ncbi:uncharacterized protein LOC144031787 [Festucalex cinctus]